VRFWGHGSALEATFFVDEARCVGSSPTRRLLNVFDCNRDVICAAAAKVYVRGGRGSYDLVAADFRK
jgi:hypothetical protein